jgi:hypothetical protein
LYLTERQKLDVGVAPSITITGTKYTGKGADYLIKASRNLGQEQCLFLVCSESGEVVLHNGDRRLGLVADHVIKFVKNTIQKHTAETGADAVIECELARVGSNYQAEWTFKSQPTFNVTPTHIVSADTARKFAKKYRVQV